MLVFHQASRQVDKDNKQHQIFLRMIQLAMVLLLVDIASRLDGRPDTAYASINAMGNFVMFLMSPVYPTLWLMYVQSQVVNNSAKTKKMFNFLKGCFAVHVLTVIGSLEFGWYYYIDAENIYHRGPFFGVPVMFTMAIIGYSYYLILQHRNYMAKKNYLTLIFFAVPPILGIVLQYLFYGATLVLSGVVLSLLLVYFSIQNQRIHTDFLTGVYNRNKLDHYMERRVKLAGVEGPFSAILIDLDDFKTINDTLGHDMGDDALEMAASLLSACIDKEDILARYGGDEFCIVLRTGEPSHLRLVISRIEHAFEAFNKSGQKEYKLYLSIGKGTYDPETMETANDFLRHIDRQMYHDKRLKKSKSLQLQGKRSV